MKILSRMILECRGLKAYWGKKLQNEAIKETAPTKEDGKVTG
ncbi:MAG: hypothetical protein JWP78_1516 [Mucilaginibacter sp.]|nr:hypothetical protein [Mucilaginibacter sp.]